MFLAAAPYFQSRFHTSASLLSTFQPTEISISSLVNLVTLIILTNLQTHASYPRRIVLSLLLNVATFTLLSISTKAFLTATAAQYFVFLMIIVALASSAAGFMQNGAFAFAAGMGRQEYVQALMAGQGVAGIIPLVVQIASTLSTGDAEDARSEAKGLSDSALVYFVTATAVEAVALGAFMFLSRRHQRHQMNEVVSASTPAFSDNNSNNNNDDDLDTTSAGYETETPSLLLPQQQPLRSTKTPLLTLFRQLFYPSLAISTTFAVTMLFPVFTAEILSTTPDASPLLRPAVFIPLSFLVWNTGDLLGRLVPLIHRLSLAERPRILFCLSVARVVFIPTYYLCNIQRGGSSNDTSTISFLLERTTNIATAAGTGTGIGTYGDFFYLFIVQFPFGLSNGYIGSCCMMGATSESFVREEQREAAGSFMGLCLVLGLTVGSLASFLVT